MTGIQYTALGDKLFVNFAVGGVPQTTVLPNTEPMRESLDRVIAQGS